MTRVLSLCMAILLAALIVLSPLSSTQLSAAPMLTATTTALLYRDPDADIEARVSDLLSRMTLDEKIGQMTLIEKNSIQPQQAAQYAIGGVLSGGGGYPRGNNTAAGWAQMVDEFQQAALSTRLAIPLIYGVDAVHGHNNVYGATIFPHNIGLGATRDADLVERIGRATAEEMIATGIYWNYAPVLAVLQDVRWGRSYESYGEDTMLVSDLGTAFLRGLQTDTLGAAGSVLATPKHFVGDGGTIWGTSTTFNGGVRYQLDQGVTGVDEQTLRRIHLPPYKAAIEAGAMSVMISFSSWGGMKMHAQQYLITEVLKGELGFHGFVVSDWGGIDQITTDYYAAVVDAINAGIDMNMVPYDAPKFIATLNKAVQQGDVSITRIDDAVSRILRTKMALGLFERPLSDPELLQTVGSAAHRALAREAVQKSLVLLKNDNDALPIDPSTPLIFVAGRGANDIGTQSGGWTIEWQGREGNITEGSTILDGIKAAASAGTNVVFDRLGRFRSTEATAAIGIVVVAEAPYAEGIGDDADLALSTADVAILQRMRERAEKVILVVLSGRPLMLTEHLSLTDAVVAAWLPGSEGAGVADGLFGTSPFTGKLPVTWMRSIDQLPLGSTDGEPLFPYGFGLALN